MDLFILDSQFRRTEVIDRYVSFIWTERVSSSGDFELSIHSTLSSRTLLTAGSHLAINESSRVMTIETIEDTLDSDGRALLNIKGPSLEDIFDDRIARDVVTSPIPDTWGFTDVLPAVIIRTIFKQICIDLSIDPGDAIPYYTAGNFYPTDTIAEPADPVTLQVSISSLYDAIKQLCDIYLLGFRLVRHGDNSEIMFNIFPGNDRTTSQTILPAVIFAPELDNLQDISYLTAVGAYKNVAYVVSPDGSQLVYADNVDSSISGFERKVILVDASSIRFPDRSQLDPIPYTVTDVQQASIQVAQGLSTTTQFQNDSLGKITSMQRLLGQDLVNINTVLTLVGTTLTSTQKSNIQGAVNTSSAYNPTEDAALAPLLIQKGVETLAQNTNLVAFDGEIPQSSQYVYERDYYLGDIVEIRNSDKVTNQMRVTEQIFASDAQGDRSYPTLAVKELISAGSWYAEPTTEVWDDLNNPADTWDSRP